MMLVVTILAARWVSLHLAVPSQPYVRLEIGGVALGLVLLAEFRVHSLASRYFHKRVLVDPRPGVRNGLLRDAWAFCHPPALEWQSHAV